MIEAIGPGQLGPDVLDAVGRAVAAAAAQVDLGAEGPAAGVDGGPVADDALLEQALDGIDVARIDEVGPAEGLDLLFLLLPLAFVADRLGIDPDERSLGRELPRQGRFGHGPDLLGDGRTAGHPVVDIDDLVQGSAGTRTGPASVSVPKRVSVTI